MNDQLNTDENSLKKIRFAVNRAGIDKNWDFKLLSSEFKDCSGTIEDVVREVKAGHALCAGLLGDMWRSKSNVIGSHWILLDIDNSDVLRDEAGKPVKGEDGKAIKVYKPDLTLEEAIAHQFVKSYCALIYTTASHQPEWHKFRMVFVLPEFIKGADAVEACTRLLMKQFPHDPACKDASRVFYGSTQAEFPLLQPNATLPPGWVEEARNVVEQERIEFAERLKEVQTRRRKFLEGTQQWAHNNSLQALIEQALSLIPPRTIGSGNYQECLSVLMALHSHYGEAEAEAIGERWSPTIPGSTWDVGAKLRSFGRGNGSISLGTLFYIAKQYGFRFPKPEYLQAAKDNQNEPDQQAYEHYVEWEKEQEKVEEIELKNSLINFFKAQADRIAKTLFGRRKKDKDNSKESCPNHRNELIIKSEQQMPTFEEYVKMGSPKIILPKGYNAKSFLREAIKKGFKKILNTSSAGSGKSHTRGEIGV